MYKIEFLEVRDELNNVIANTVVVRIRIEKGDGTKLYANESEEYFYRDNGKTKKYTCEETRNKLL